MLGNIGKSILPNIVNVSKIKANNIQKLYSSIRICNTSTSAKMHLHQNVLDVVPKNLQQPLKDDYQNINDVEIFNGVYSTLLNKSLKSEDENFKEFNSHFQAILDYNVTGGKKIRGLTLLHTYKQMNLNCSFQEMKLASILGWCIEILQAFYLITDDVMDRSITRRGKPCWYKKVGLIAINDAMLLESLIFDILTRHFKDSPCYPKLIEQFHRTISETNHGQCLDMLSTPERSQPKLETFTLKRFEAIAAHKSSYYSFVLPVRLALYLSGMNDEESHQQAEKILIKMGIYFQVQDDFLDAFGDPSVIGKHGTDIQDAKCSWLIVKALEMASEPQKKILHENYGLGDPQAVSTVKQIYRDLNLPQVFADFEEASHQEIVGLINQNTAVPPQIFDSLLKKIYKRNK